MPGPIDRPSSSPNVRWKRLGIFGGVTLSAWIAAWFLMNQVVADIFIVPEGTELVSRDNIVQTDGSEETAETLSATGASNAQDLAKPNNAKDYMTPILKRNLFDSSRTGQAPTIEEDESGFAATELDLYLIATMVADSPEQSLALMVSKDGKDRPQVYGPGDTLNGGAEIIEIRGRTHLTLKKDKDKGSNRRGRMQLGLTDAAYRQPSVLIQNGDKTEVLWMTGQGYGKNADPKAASTSTTEELVTKAGPNKFIVAPSLIDQITADPEALTGKVRVSAHKGPDGQVDGFRLSGIRRRSLFKQLGIKNGDIVHTVNGQLLSDANAAANAYRSLAGTSNFTFEVTRRNERQTFEYEVR